jgi:hypothetical protein
MTEPELILSDLVLLKIPINREFTQRAAYNGFLISKQDDYDQDTLAKMNNILTSENSIIIDFLLKEKYINCTNQMHERYMLVEKGEIAQREGGHKQYLIWKAKDDRRKKWEKVPTRYWLMTLAFTAIISPLIVEWLRQPKSDTTNQQDKKIQVLQDSVQLLLHQPKETLYIQRNPLSQDDSIK